MTDTKANEAARNLIKSIQDTNKAIVDTAVSTQERSLTFTQSVLENSIEVLKSHAESTRTLVQELAEEARKQQVGPEGIRALIDNTIAAQERNTRLAQSILEDGVETIKSQIGVAHSLMQELGQQFQKQQDAYQTLAQESMDAYRDFISAPFTFWQRALGFAESATLESLKTFQRAAEQGLETYQKTARQAASAAEKATRQTPSNKSAE
ncbi:MAG TPA: hypothetical protein VFA41_18825 [Ktedonobacteraceae bacterium]|jgi:predicted nucleic acid-binding protein|nr:hypothetical protein [Ktedonobacteraceae bacterium]